jgi:sulfate adenylyltransferase subunit 1
MDWYKGDVLLELLENIYIKEDNNLKKFRFPVQYVVRPLTDKYHDFRGYAGRLAGGTAKPGDDVTILPSGLNSKIKTIEAYNEKLDIAFTPQSLTITLEHDIDISRGNMIVHKNNLPKVEQEIEIMICWFNTKPLQVNGKYLIRNTSNEIKCVIKSVEHKMNINTLEKNFEDKQVGMNDIAKIIIKTAKPIYFDSYSDNRQTGSIVFIDEHTNETVGAGMIE